MSIFGVKYFVKVIFNAYKILSSWRLLCMILLIFIKVRKTTIFLGKKPEKPKGLFWSQTLTDLKTSKDLKKD